MQLNDIMTSGIVTIAGNSTCQSAAKMMKDNDIGFLAVANDERKIVGVVTDRDLVVRCMADSLDMNTSIDSLKTPKVFALPADTNVEEAARMMEEKQIHRLLVLGDNHDIVGVVTYRDLAQGTHDAELCGHIVEKVTAGS